MKAVAFDFGQTLGALDHEFMARRLREKGVSLDVSGAVRAAEQAWDVYGAHKSAGHAAAWRAMVEAQLAGGGIAPGRRAELAEWLWHEQPKQNLWRRPIAGMIELVRGLRGQGVPVGIISNSEGHLAELVAELGWGSDFEVIVDSGKLGIDKPDPRIFEHACAALGVAAEELLHVGDAWEADVQGALRTGASAVWFDERHRARELPPRVYGAANAAELGQVLAGLGLLAASRT
ncbi:MAG TPA: HAD family hydrolase [Polyangiaceae bacterium]|nr:HAD family hydrolase [Polyangiaceae bacterium]